MNNPWFRVKVQKVEGAENEIWFEHPTRVEATAATFYPNGETMHLLNGEVASPGWAERLHKDYSAAYAPKEKTNETPGKGGWEAEVAQRLGRIMAAEAAEEKEEEVVELNKDGRPITLRRGEGGRGGGAQQGRPTHNLAPRRRRKRWWSSTRT